MARISADPAAWHPLPADLAAELGLTIAGFGHLEETLKRTIFALERDDLPAALREVEFRDWLRRMNHVAADSLGTLIERLLRLLEPSARPALAPDLDEIKQWRNLLCHSAWRPLDGGRWQPVFASTDGQVHDAPLSAADLSAIRAMTLDAAARTRRLVEALDGDGNGTSE